MWFCLSNWCKLLLMEQYLLFILCNRHVPECKVLWPRACTLEHMWTIPQSCIKRCTFCTFVELAHACEVHETIGCLICHFIMLKSCSNVPFSLTTWQFMRHYVTEMWAKSGIWNRVKPITSVVCLPCAGVCVCSRVRPEVSIWSPWCWWTCELWWSRPAGNLDVGIRFGIAAVRAAHGTHCWRRPCRSTG